MNVRIEDMPDLRVACIHAPGPYATAAPQAWQELSAWMGHNQMLTFETLFVGVLGDTPCGLASESTGYDAGVSVPQHIEADGYVSVRIIAGGPCATIVHKGRTRPLRRFGRHCIGNGCPPADASRERPRVWRSTSTHPTPHPTTNC